MDRESNPDRGIATEPPDAVAVSLDALLEVLANRRRRAAIRVLDDWNADPEERGFVSVPELAHGIDSGEITPSIDRTATEDIKSLYVTLHNTHVPLLDEHGLVDYRTLGRASTLEPTPLLGDVARVLDCLVAITEREHIDGGAP